MSGQVYIGIAGWSYPDWKGIVYTRPGIDELEYVAGFVDAIEINNTFCRPPEEKICRSWLARTAGYPEFFFTAKLHRDFTHQFVIDEKMVSDFKAGFEPMLETGKLRHLLAQFKFDFSDTPQNRVHLEKLMQKFGGVFEIVVEVRHRSWQQEGALGFLSGLGVTVCNLDYPTSSSSFDMAVCKVGKSGYMRLHGRNRENWFKKSSRDETYNYYYSENELKGIEDRIRELAEAFGQVTVIANNHYRGGELANAIELKAMLSGIKQAIPEGLLKEYPGLAKFAGRKA